MKIVLRFIVQILGLIVLIFMQVGFFSAFETLRPFAHLVLFFLLYLTLVTDIRTGLTWALLAGIGLDILSIYAIGTITLSFMLTLTFIYILFRQYISNVSLYSLLLLISFGTALYWVFLYVFSWTFFFLGLHPLGLELGSFSWTLLFWQIVTHNVLSVLLFYFLRSLRKNFFRLQHV